MRNCNNCGGPQRKGMFVDNDIPSPMMTNEQYNKSRNNG